MILIQILYLLALSETSGASEKPIFLKRGEAYQLKLQGNLYIENGNIIKGYPAPYGYNIVGKKLGATSLKIQNKEYNFEVLYKQDYDYYQALKDSIKGIRGLKLDFNGKCSVLSGRILLWQDYLDIIQSMQSKINHSCKDGFLLKARFALLNNDLNKKMDLLFQKENLETPEYSLKPYPHFHIPNDEKLEEVLRKYGFSFDKNKENLEIRPNIETKIYVLEVRKSELSNIGINWPDHINLEGKKLKLDGESISASVHALEESGNGRILASPKILTANGKEGNFLAGGELPIRATGYQFSKVVWKTYGISLKVKPRSDTKDNVYLDLKVEISMPDYANRIEGIPGFLKNQMNSQFFLKDKEYLVLSGLIKQEKSKSNRGLPGLHKIPILGSLFGSEAYKEQKTELIIMVKPEIKRIKK